MTNTRQLVDSAVGNDFGLSIDTVAEKCKRYGRFNSWLNQDVSKIKRVLTNVKNVGISPAFFASYEKSEGYNNKWGWLNHTVQKGDYYQDATSVANVVLNQSKNMSGNPSWIDYGNPVDFVPQSVKNEGNTHFRNLPSGTIGRALIPLTAAATWATYYPKGLLKEYNKVQNYADPIKVIADTIIEWGGSFDESPTPDPEPEPDPDYDGDWEGIDLQKFIQQLNQVIQSMFTQDIYQSGNSQFYQNEYVQLMNQLKNTFKIKPTNQFYKKITKVFDDFNDTYIPPPDPKPDPEPDPDPPSNEMFFPVRLASGVNFWKRANWGVGTLQRNMTYGTRSNGKFHAGYDIGSDGVSGLGIYAVRAGVVTHVENRSTAGFVIAINHSTDSYHTLYMHLVPNSNLVKVGDRVEAGQRIATMGASGGNYPIHLHIELSKTGKFHTAENTLDPEPYLQVNADNKTRLPIP